MDLGWDPRRRPNCHFNISGAPHSRLYIDLSLTGMRKVLYDALVHGFVQMAKLSLLVFDEGKAFFFSSMFSHSS